MMSNACTGTDELTNKRNSLQSRHAHAIDMIGSNNKEANQTNVTFCDRPCLEAPSNETIETPLVFLSVKPCKSTFITTKTKHSGV